MAAIFHLPAMQCCVSADSLECHAVRNVMAVRKASYPQATCAGAAVMPGCPGRPMPAENIPSRPRERRQPKAGPSRVTSPVRPPQHHIIDSPGGSLPLAHQLHSQYLVPYPTTHVRHPSSTKPTCLKQGPLPAILGPVSASELHNKPLRPPPLSHSPHSYHLGMQRRMPPQLIPSSTGTSNHPSSPVDPPRIVTETWLPLPLRLTTGNHHIFLGRKQVCPQWGMRSSGQELPVADCMKCRRILPSLGLWSMGPVCRHTRVEPATSTSTPPILSPSTPYRYIHPVHRLASIART